MDDNPKIAETFVTTRELQDHMTGDLRKMRSFRLNEVVQINVLDSSSLYGLT
jgi:hypothetical protein